MRRIIVALVISSMLLSGGLSIARAEEDIFDTKSSTPHLGKGITLLSVKKYDAAIAELQEAVTISPEAEAFYYLGYAYYLKGRTNDAKSRKKAIENFDKAYELDPNFTPNKEPIAAKSVREKTERRKAQVVETSSKALGDDDWDLNPANEQ